MPFTPYSPPHINQFHKADGTKWQKTDGTDFNGANCWAAIGAIAGDAGTRGKLTLTPPQVRKESGDREGGANVGDIARVLRAHGVKAIVPPGGASWNLIEHRAKSGRWYTAVAVDYDGIPDDKSCQEDFHDYHMMGLRSIDERGEFGDDPLCNTVKVYPHGTFRRAAEIAQRRAGSSGLMVCFVRIPPAPQQDPPPPADPCADVADQLAEAQDQLAAAQDQLAAIRAVLAG